MTEPEALPLPLDIGSEQPAAVLQVMDYTGPGDEFDDDSPYWGRTDRGEWKGYKNGGKVYLEWAELVRRWGPVLITKIQEVPF